MIPDAVSYLPSTRRRLWLWILLSAVAIAYVILVARYCAVWAGGSDSSGYLNSTRILLKGDIRETISFLPDFAPPQSSAANYQPLGYLVTLDKSGAWMSPTYPIGLPLHYVLASFFVGIEQSPALVNALIALVSAIVLATFAHKLGLRWSWALGGVAILWSCPLFVQYLLQPMSDNLALMWSLIAIALAWHSREKWRWSIGVGAVVAIAVLVRPTSVLILPGVIIAMGFRWKNWLGCALGALPGAVFLLSYNYTLYGDPFTTGYGSQIGMSFKLAYGLLSAPHLVYWVPVLLSPFVILLSLAGIWSLRSRKQLLLTLLAWPLMTIGCYTFYYHTHETWWYLRFILPAFPAIILLALFGGQKTLERFSPSRHHGKWMMAIFICITTWQLWWGHSLKVLTIKSEERTYPTVANWANQNLPANAIVLQMQTSGAFRFYTQFTSLRWDLMSREDFIKIEQVAAAAHRPLYAVLYDFEKIEFDQKHSGTWEKVSQQRLAGVWKLTQPVTSSQP